MDPRRRRIVRSALFALLAVGALLRIDRAFPVAPDALRIVSDEGFRFLGYARARAPLEAAPWTLALSLLRDAQAASALGIALDVIAMGLVFRVARRLGASEGASLLGVALLALNRSAVVFSTSGGPSSLAAAAFLVLVDAQVRRGRSPFAFGAIAGAVAACTFELVVPAAMVVALRRDRARAFVPFVPLTLLSRVLAGSIVPPALASQAALEKSTEGRSALAAILETGAALVRATGAGTAFFGLVLGLAVASIAVQGARVRTVYALRALSAPLLAALVGAFGFVAWSPPNRTQLAIASALFPLVVAVAIDRLLRSSRRPAAIAFGFGCLVVASAAATRRPVELVARSDDARIPPGERVLCAPCGAIRAPRLDLHALEASGARDALRDGRLLAWLRSAGVSIVAVDRALLDERLFGARFREGLRAIDDRGDVFRVAPLGDDALGITSAVRPVSFGSPHLGDGWRIAGDEVVSRAARAELLFVLPAVLGPEPRVQLRLHAMHPEGQTVDVEVDGTAVGRLHVEEAPRWYDVPVSAAKAGRTRVRLLLGAARGARAQRAVAIEAVRFLRGDEPELPSSGPPDPALFVEGWNEVERGAGSFGVWAASARAVVRFFARRAADGATLDLEIGPPPRVGDRKGQTLLLRLNDAKLGEIELPPDAVSRRSLSVPASAIVAGENVLTFHAARVVRDGGTSRAFYVRAIALRPTP